MLQPKLCTSGASASARPHRLHSMRTPDCRTRRVCGSGRRQSSLHCWRCRWPRTRRQACIGASPRWQQAKGRTRRVQCSLGCALMLLRSFGARSACSAAEFASVVFRMCHLGAWCTCVRMSGMHLSRAAHLTRVKVVGAEALLRRCAPGVLSTGLVCAEATRTNGARLCSQAETGAASGA